MGLPLSSIGDLLPIIPHEQKEAFKEASKSALESKYKEARNLGEKRRFARGLKGLEGLEGLVGVGQQEREIEMFSMEFHCIGTTLQRKQEIIQKILDLGSTCDDLKHKLVVDAMIAGNYTIVTPHKEALELHETLNELYMLTSITVSDIAAKVPVSLFAEGKIKEIKYLPSDKMKSKEIHTVTNEMVERYKHHFSFGPVHDIFVALTKKIDEQYSPPTFNLEHKGEMERIIRAALWIDLLSLGADMGHRDLSTQMDDSGTLEAIAAAKRL